MKRKVMLNKHRVHEALEIKGMTMTDLASALGTSTANLYNWFANGFDSDVSKQIVEILKCSERVLTSRIGGGA